MTGASYTVYLCDPFGVRLADASAFTRMEYSRVVNAPGGLSLTLPGDFPPQLIRAPDGRVEVWRRLPDGREYLVTDTVWFIQAVEYTLDDDGTEAITLQAQSGLWLLDGRFVDAFAGSAEARKADSADDMIKAIVREQLGASASAARQAPGLSVDGDVGAAPSLTRSFAWEKVLDTCQRIAAASTEAGTYLAFDVVSPTPQNLIFRTFTGQRGVDRRVGGPNPPVLIGPEFGTMGRTALRYDYGEEITYVKAGGQGEESGRLTGEAQDDMRLAASPYRRRERFLNATQYKTTTGLNDEAASAVREGRPRVTLEGEIINSPQARFGVEWDFGDYLTVQAFGQSVAARVEAVTVRVEGGRESVEATLRGEVG